jgi:hypothetical protein
MKEFVRKFRIPAMLGLLVVAMFCLVSFGAEAPAATPVTTTPVSSWWETLLQSSLVWDGVKWVGTLFFGWMAVLVARKWTLDQAAKDGIEALRLGVVKCYHDEVQGLKESLGDDGKISAVEAKRLRGIAIDNAKEIASGPGGKWLQNQGMAVLHAWVERIVNREKNQAPPGSV